MFEVGRSAWRVVALGLVLAALAAASYLMTHKPSLTDEERIREVLREAEEAVEAKNVRGCLQHVSESYHDEYGNDKHELYRKAIAGFRNVEPFNLTVTVMQIRVEGDRAYVSLEVDFSAGERAVRGVAMDVVFAREGRRWRAISATNYEECGAAL